MSDDIDIRLVPQRNFQDGGTLRAKNEDLANLQATRRRLAAMRVHQVHHGDPEIPRHIRVGDNTKYTNKATSLPLSVEPALCAPSEDVLQAHVLRQDAQVASVSDSFWRRQNYGQRFRDKGRASAVLEVRVRDLRLEACNQHKQGIHEDTMRTIALQSDECKDIMGGPRELPWPLGHRPGGERDDAKRGLTLSMGSTAAAVLTDGHVRSDPSRVPNTSRHGIPVSKGAEEFLDQYEHVAAFPNEALITAYNCPYVEIHRDRKSQQDATTTDFVNDVLLSECGGAQLARLAQTVRHEELVVLAPRLEVLCFEVCKEEALVTAIHLGAAARDSNPTDQVILHRAVMALIASAASRCRDAHSALFPIEGLEAMSQTGVGAPTYVDMFLAALYVQISRGSDFSVEVAERTARAVQWAAEAFADNSGNSLAVGPAGRRALGTVISKLQNGPEPEHVAPLLDLLRALSAEAACRTAAHS